MRKTVLYGLGFLLLLVNAYFGTYAYVVTQALLWTQTALQRGPLVMLFALVCVNLGFLKFAKKWALSQKELIILYAMLCVGTCVAGYGFVQILINQIPAPFYENYATGGSKFKDYIWPNIPEWLVPRDPDVLNGFFRGNTTLWTPANLKGWVVPVLAWSAFIIAVFWTLLCAMSLFRKQWIEEERLTFPLVLLPLEITQNGGRAPIFKSPLFWAGVVIAGLLESVNYLNFLYPSVPSIPLKPGMGFNEIGPLLTERPWNTVGRFTLAFYPSIIGIAYLLSLEVNFSCWSMYLVQKAMIVSSAWLGLSESGGGGPTNRMPFIKEQGLGAFAGIALFSLWMARKPLKKAIEALEKPVADDTHEELMSARLALLGGLGGLLFMTLFLTAAGASFWQSLTYVLIYTCCAITLARIVSEAGAGWAWAPMWGNGQFVADTFGQNHLSGKEATLLIGYTSWMNDMRDNPMPHSAEALKMAQGGGISPRALLKPLLFAIIVGTLAAFWAHLDIYYTYGAATAKVRPALQNGATGPARQAVSLLVSPTLADVPGVLGTGFGALVALVISVIRQRVNGFPLHPLGYAVGMTNTMEYMWCPFLIAWVLKAITLRYAGIGGYRKLLPFFLGLILGDYVIPTLWGIFGMLTGYQMYMVFPH
ncbi:DUF6785 family protein [Armatimonas sp.]|uniref:DUF6785 family protein n=1 Tax=Armatimonas sp. TaxID=1872638 RepID=UPI003750DE40